MDTVNMIIDIVSSLGFPIACCVALFWRSYKDEEARRQEMEKMRITIENNTIALTKLCDKVDNE